MRASDARMRACVRVHVGDGDAGADWRCDVRRADVSDSGGEDLRVHGVHRGVPRLLPHPGEAQGGNG
eukprot:358037-Chlamydomonas_euryale.AAC.2